jgi:glycine reductase
VQLDILDHSLGEIRWGDRTILSGGTLFINPSDLDKQIKDSTRSIGVGYDLAQPGESKRILHVLDTLVPIEKTSGASHTFPGIDGPAELVGTGVTVRLKNMLITISGLFPDMEIMTPLERPREGIIDMSGAGAPYSYGSDSFHLVVRLEPDRSLSNMAFDQALRTIGVKLARYLGNVDKTDVKPARRTVRLAKPRKKLPKVVLIYQFQGQIPFARTFYYGEDISRTLPTYVHPNEFIDGAIISGTYKSERKIPTSLHCANPFIDQLVRRHGKDVEFLGVVLSRGYNDSLEQKRKMGLWSARLAGNLGAEGAIAIMEGTGNATVDFMQTVKACEDHGIKTVAVLHETDGPKGYEPPLVDHPEEADAMISRGNASERIYLPPLDAVVGGDEMDLHFKSKHDPRRPLIFDPTIFFGAFSKMGSSGFRAVYEN